MDELRRKPDADILPEQVAAQANLHEPHSRSTSPITAKPSPHIQLSYNDVLQLNIAASFSLYCVVSLLFVVVLMSFLAWPTYLPLWASTIKYLLCLSCIVIYLFSLNRLSRWQLNLQIAVNQHPNLLSGAVIGKISVNQNWQDDVNVETFELIDNAFISPILVIFTVLKANGDKQKIILCADALTPQQYRHLCRILHTANTSKQ